VTDAGRAVFLSYASQDAEAALQLCTALRAAGIEVWFDQNELRGGDTWDGLIRQHIKGCYLFVPMISANTQAREEGYFRREWKLAVDRTNDMAGDRAFLLPVVLDDTSQAEARVPEKFCEVQWTRLPAGANTDAFIEHVQRLLSPVAKIRAEASARSSVLPISSTAAAPARSTRAGARSFLPWIVIGLLILAAGYFLVDKSLLSRRAAPAGEAVSDKSVAVLPFADMSEKKDQEYFSDGLAEELIEELAKTPGLKVIARTSSFSFKGKSDDIATIAAKLKVANILEGSVRRSSDQLRVSTQLIRADTGQAIWSETFEREFKDVFKIQDDIAAAVASALKVQLTGDAVASRGHGTANPQAYNAFLLGKQLFNQNTVDGWRQAIEAYREAVRLDPRYAEAYAALALSEYFLSDGTGDAALGKSAEQVAQRSIDINPELADGYSVRGLLRADLHFDWTGALADDRRAVALEPSNSRVLSRAAEKLSAVGRLDEAVAMYRKAIEHDPLDDAPLDNLGIDLTAAGNTAAAYDAFRLASAIRSAPSTSNGLASLQLLDGKAREALATFRTTDNEVFRNAGIAMAEHSLGDAKASQQALDQLIATDAADAAYQIAQVYAWRREKDKAFEWLDRAYRQLDGGLASTRVDPLLASLHGDPRYAALLRKLNFPP
jgi:TolB-like protein/tetratricopeptide (TPR) repeat protein